MAYRPSSRGPKIKRDIRTPTTPDCGLKLLPSENVFSREDSFPSEISSSRKTTPRTNGSVYGRTSGRTPTPTKQVSLQAARRKESDSQIDNPPFDWTEYERQESARLQSRSSNHDSDSKQNKSNHESNTDSYGPKRRDYSDLGQRSSSKRDWPIESEAASGKDSAAEEMLKKCYKRDNVSELMDDLKVSDYKRDSKQSITETEGALGGSKSQTQEGDGDIDDSDAFDTDLEDEEEEGGEEEAEEKPQAPTDLLMEFLHHVMNQEWKNAQKLCNMILMYEPNHPEALEFKATIEEKVQLEEELANMSSEEDGSEEEGEEGDEEGDSDDSDDSSDDDDSSGDVSDDQDSDVDEGASGNAKVEPPS